jgi:large subunit ribosomal protein L24
MKVKKDDNVIIIAGKDKGFKGKVIQIDKKKDRLIVDGANLIKKHIKPPNKKEKGKRIEMPTFIHVSNVKLYCSNCKKGVRVGFKEEKDKKGETLKVRICKKCKKQV